MQKANYMANRNLHLYAKLPSRYNTITSACTEELLESTAEKTDCLPGRLKEQLKHCTGNLALLPPRPPRPAKQVQRRNSPDHGSMPRTCGSTPRTTSQSSWRGRRQARISRRRRGSRSARQEAVGEELVLQPGAVTGGSRGTGSGVGGASSAWSKPGFHRGASGTSFLG